MLHQHRFHLNTIFACHNSRYNSAVQRDTATHDHLTWRSKSGASSSPLIPLRDRRLLFVIAFAVFVGFLAYQVPLVAHISIGQFGDRLFLNSGEGQGELDRATFYGDEIDGAPGNNRSRWTRSIATISMPGVGNGRSLQLTVTAQGWPADVLASTPRQPIISVLANGQALGTFVPTDAWAEYHFGVPAVPLGTALDITFQASGTFTSTATYIDPRPKGIRLKDIAVRGSAAPFTLPAAFPVALLALDGVICLLALIALTRYPNLAFVLTALTIIGMAFGLAFMRLWAIALLPWCTVGFSILLFFGWRTTMVSWLRRISECYTASNALGWGLVAMLWVWLGYLVVRISTIVQLLKLDLFSQDVPLWSIVGMTGLGVVLLALVYGDKGLPHVARLLVQGYASRRGALAILVALMVVWVGYEASVIANIPYVGHADYADNAVVARNLIAGRGWVVDYVTQFYQLYDGVTRPQETWPLLQPVWVAPFLAAFGSYAWAAKIPNLLFTVALAMLIFAIGARIWDRRVGLTAVFFILTNYLFFTLVIYVTSDLAFTVFSFGAIGLLFRATDAHKAPVFPSRGGLQVRQRGAKARRPLFPLGWLLLGSSVCTGLMLLQKPASGGLIALGMGLWFVGHVWHTRFADGVAPPIAASYRMTVRTFLARLAPVAAWAVIAMLVLSPYLVRNVWLFGTPFYSTESRDAWVIEYTTVWDMIYKVYVPSVDPTVDGPPDRSWVLRWGFDRSWLKLVHQVEALREYMLPPWVGLPLNLGNVSIGKVNLAPLLFDMGAWLAGIGVLGALWARHRLVALLLASFGPYVLFLLTYWHANEERYFVMVMPWLALLASFALWQGYDYIARIGRGRWTPVALALVLASSVLVVQPSWPRIAEKITLEPQLYTADLAAYTWLRDHSAKGDVAMTRNPWQLNWQSERPALMIPYTTDRQVFLRLARHYQVRYLVLDSLQRPRLDVRQMLDALLSDPSIGFERVYSTSAMTTSKGEMTTSIYRFPANYGGVAELRP